MPPTVIDPLSSTATLPSLSVPKLSADMLTAVGNSSNVGRYEQDYMNYQKGAKTGIDYYNEATNQLGIPDVRAKVQALRRQIADVQNLTDAVDPSVTGRTQGGLVTEAQRNRLVASEKAPLLQGLTSLGNIFSAESGNLSDLTGEAGNLGNLAYGSQQDLMQTLIDRITRSQGNKTEAQRQKEAAMVQALAERSQSLNERTAAAQQSAAARLEALQQSILDAMNTTSDTEAGDDGYGDWLGLGGGLQVGSANNLSLGGATYNPQATLAALQRATTTSKSPTIQGSGAASSKKLSVTKANPGKVTVSKPKNKNTLSVVY